jgi:hypothetical protein
MKVKVMLTLSVDEEVYPMPSDERIDEEVKDYLSDLIHEVDGFTLNHMKVLIGEKKYD